MLKSRPDLEVRILSFFPVSMPTPIPCYTQQLPCLAFPLPFPSPPEWRKTEKAIATQRISSHPWPCVLVNGLGQTNTVNLHHSALDDYKHHPCNPHATPKHDPSRCRRRTSKQEHRSTNTLGGDKKGARHTPHTHTRPALPLLLLVAVTEGQHGG